MTVGLDAGNITTGVVHSSLDVFRGACGANKVSLRTVTMKLVLRRPRLIAYWALGRLLGLLYFLRPYSSILQLVEEERIPVTTFGDAIGFAGGVFELDLREDNVCLVQVLVFR